MMLYVGRWETRVGDVRKGAGRWKRVESTRCPPLVYLRHTGKPKRLVHQLWTSFCTVLLKCAMLYIPLIILFNNFVGFF